MGPGSDNPASEPLLPCRYYVYVRFVMPEILSRASILG